VGENVRAYLVVCGTEEDELIMAYVHTVAPMSEQVEIIVLYFAAASTATGLTSERILIPTCPPFKLSSLSKILISRHRDSNLEKVLQTSQWSVDTEMVHSPDDVILDGGEEVAIICPVSGG
jgi:molybdopterin converting factor small subunit